MTETPIEGNPSWAMVSGEPQLDEIADLARQLIGRLDRLPRRAAIALDVAGWHSVKAFGMRAELTHLIECADRARHGTVRAIARRWAARADGQRQRVVGARSPDSKPDPVGSAAWTASPG
jgi:hypothetical protein